MTTEPRDHVDRLLAEWHRERPDLDTSAQGLIGRLHRLGAHLQAEIDDAIGEYGITSGEFDVLAALRRAGTPFERTPSQLAESTMITSGAATKRVDRLEGAGLLTRTADAHDARVRRVRLTPRGRRLADRVLDAHVANEHRLLEPLSPRDRRRLTELLRHWLIQLES